MQIVIYNCIFLLIFSEIIHIILNRKNTERKVPIMNQNLLFIGDNLTVMNSDEFNQRVSEKIKMIYIDPPYNTGSSFSYKDKIDRDAWLLFMQERLMKAKKFLKEDGCIFISIDDSEYAYLKVLCDDVFGSANFVGTFITQQAQRSNAKHINIVHEYILCYAKNKKKLAAFKVRRIDIPEQKKMIDKMYQEIKPFVKANDFDSAQKKLNQLIIENCEEYNITWLRNYSNIDKDGRIYFSKDLSTPGKPRRVSIPEIGLYLEPLRTRSWSTDRKLIELYKKDRLVFKGNRPYEKHYLEEAEDNVPSILNYYSRQGTNDLNHLGLRDIFDTPKPVELIKFLIRIATKDDDTILDFFAGSGTTAQAVYEINQEDNRNNHYVLIQLDEPVRENTNVYKTCLNYGIEPVISEITKYRINTYLKSNDMPIDYITL